MHNVLGVDIDAPHVPEFRVQPLNRYQVTEWDDYRGGRCRTIADNLTLEQANRIAVFFGKATPGALVNTMEPCPTNSPPPMPLGRAGAIAAIQALPYETAALIRTLATKTSSWPLLELLDEAQVAVDLKASMPCVMLAVDDAMKVRADLKTFNMTTELIDRELARIAVVTAT
jgi:hypothetical protein